MVPKLENKIPSDSFVVLSIWPFSSNVLALSSTTDPTTGGFGSVNHNNSPNLTKGSKSAILDIHTKVAV